VVHATTSVQDFRVGTREDGDLEISYNKLKRRQVKVRTQLPPMHHATLESFGFDITGSNKIGGNLACATLSTNNDQIPKCYYPFVKWAGGKRQLLWQLYPLAPVKFDRYIEPFLGGGALFFHLISQISRRLTAYISDINSELINVYVAVKDYIEKLIKLLKQHEIEYNQAPKEYYYKLRSCYNLGSSCDKLEKAAQFIALNRTCFNGLYRVNGSGSFNVPWGKYVNPSICDSSNLRNVSIALRYSKVEIKVSDYKEMLLENAKEGDFIYLDPPYSPVSSTAYFTNYTTDGFSYKDQKELAERFRQLDEMKCKVMLTNSNTPLVRELYAPFARHTIEVNSKRAINCKASKREGHTDLIIRNYS
jgi:DNA adenine methylase